MSYQIKNIYKERGIIFKKEPGRAMTPKAQVTKEYWTVSEFKTSVHQRTQ